MDKRKEIKRLQEILEMMKEPGMFSHRTYKDHWWRTYGNKYKELIKQYKKDFISLMPTNLYGYFDNFDLYFEIYLHRSATEMDKVMIEDVNNEEIYDNMKDSVSDNIINSVINNK